MSLYVMTGKFFIKYISTSYILRIITNHLDISYYNIIGVDYHNELNFILFLVVRNKD